MANATQWPVKTREIEDAYFDSGRWNDFPVRDGDVVVATFPKMGTTWTLEIVWQLIHGAPPQVGVMTDVAWVDMRIIPYPAIRKLYDAQTARRALKTHLPLDALTFSPKAKYIVVGRDARDMVWSAYHHHGAYTDEHLDTFNSPAGRPGPPVLKLDRDVRDYYLGFLEEGVLPGFGFMPLWPHLRSWWPARTLPNVLMVHYARLKADLAGEVRRIARFLAIPIDKAAFLRLLEHCGIDHMRANVPEANRVPFYKGVNGRWREVLTPAEVARCDEEAARHLTPDCAHWLVTGELTD